MKLTDNIWLMIGMDDPSQEIGDLNDAEFVVRFDKEIRQAVDGMMKFVDTFDLVPKKKRLCVAEFGIIGANCVRRLNAKEIRETVTDWFVRSLRQSIDDYVLSSESDQYYYSGELAVDCQCQDNIVFSLRGRDEDLATAYVMTICELK